MATHGEKRRATFRLVLLLTICGWTLLSLGFPAHTLWNQYRQRQALTAEVEHLRTARAQALEGLAHAQDPHVIASAARARLGYAYPGEQSYVVFVDDPRR